VTKYVIRHGRRIAVETLDLDIVPKKKRKPFEVLWVKLPLHWAKVLRQSKSTSTYQLAHTILFEAFKREHVGGEIVLSSTVTGMPRETRRRAANELVKLGLIEIKQNGREALRISRVYYYYENREETE
jgi:hypothetical protein